MPVVWEVLRLSRWGDRRVLCRRWTERRGGREERGGERSSDQVMQGANREERGRREETVTKGLDSGRT
jgi:hypothetical protein